MDSLNLDRHLRSAVFCIKAHPFVFYWIVFIAAWNTASTLLEGNEIGPLGISAFILSLCTTPVIYGLLYDRTIGSCSTPGTVIRTYVPGYFWLLIRMYLPALFVALMPMMLAPQAAGEGHFFVILITFSIAYIFVIPCYFVTGKQSGAILSGLSFLARNFSSCTPVLLTVVLIEAALLLVENNGSRLLEIGPVLFGFIDFFVFIIASVIDYLLFIMLVLILRTSADENQR